MKRLTDKVALITGGSRGIGLAIAHRIVDEGGRVAITGRTPETLTAAVAQLGGPERALGLPGRADHPEHQASAVAAVLKAYGSLDVLVNNAGINPAFGPLMELDLAAARKILDVNLTGALAWTQAAYAASLRERGGCVINVASVAGQRPAPGIGFYGVSKAGLIHLTEELAVELGPRVRVNAIAPAVVKTEFAKPLYAGREDEVSRAYPLKRLGEVGDVASVVAFLASDDAGWMTGQTLTIDGGLLLAGGV